MADDISSLPHDELSRRGLLFVLSSPSGAGKSTLARMLLEADDQIAMSVSVTTRPKRPGEEHGKDYYFVSGDEFEEMVADHAFLEYATVFGNRYATPAAPVQKNLEDGQDVLFDIDWQGTQQLYQRGGQDVVRIFILPPSLAILEQRLNGRGQDEPAIIRQRLAEAQLEMSHYTEADFLVINDHFDTALTELRSIIISHRLKLDAQCQRNSKLLKDLLS